jgi:hypothetical protein
MVLFMTVTVYLYKLYKRSSLTVKMATEMVVNSGQTKCQTKWPPCQSSNRDSMRICLLNLQRKHYEERFLDGH